MSQAVDPLAPADVLRAQGRSFHWAARFMSAATAGDAAVLYAFCRRIDDLGDETAPERAGPALDAVFAALDGGPVPDRETERFLGLAQRRGISLDAARALVRAVRADLDAPQLPDGDALIQYAHGVAGTVGVMMCPVLGVRDPRAWPFAVDLGIAMQLTNIARDVGEDAASGRRYLPATWLGGPLSPAELCAGDSEVDGRVRRALARTLETADRYYASAERGMRFIPARARLAILAARHIYAAIGPRVLAAHDWRRRAAVPPGRKAVCSLAALMAFAHPRTWDVGSPSAHDPALHASIAGRVGADPDAPA
ncbi:phytoene synthase [Limimonas halophila]|uniref:Phytoene synthase n=1 Tax=Limimonas halophila TaxID=1082479 RepID=A0A1G7QQL4_9PROT|nr:phytoene/squalene synthase family protein [Limimonas halophila]SDG00831.1 phytoene synthase [Limimonas halophila]